MNYGDEAGTKTFSYTRRLDQILNSFGCHLLLLLLLFCCCFCYLHLSTLDANITYTCAIIKIKIKTIARKLDKRPSSFVVWPAPCASTQPYHPSHGSTWAMQQLWKAVSALLNRAERLKYFSFHSDDIIIVEFKPSMQCLDYLEPKLSPSPQPKKSLLFAKVYQHTSSQTSVTYSGQYRQNVMKAQCSVYLIGYVFMMKNMCFFPVGLRLL